MININLNSFGKIIFMLKQLKNYLKRLFMGNKNRKEIFLKINNIIKMQILVLKLLI